MMPRKLATVAGALLAGCVVSLETAIPESARTDTPELLGSWVSGDNERAVIMRGDSGFLIRYTDSKGQTGTYQGRAGTVGGRLALEVSPRPDSTEMNEGYRLSMIPGRWLFLLRLEAGSARTVSLKGEDVDDAVRSGAVPGPAMVRDDYTILTGDTTAVRAMYAALFARRGLLSTDTTTWRRVAGP